MRSPGERGKGPGVREMKSLKNRLAGVFTAALFAVAMVAAPSSMHAQANAKLHGHVVNPAGLPLAGGEVRLTTDRNPNNPNRKYDYTFPIDASGNYSGSDIKPGDYLGIVFQNNNTVDFQPAKLAAGDDKTVDFDMTRKEYLDKMTPAEKEQLENYKKNATAAQAANAKIANLNTLLNQARADTQAGKFDSAIKSMTDATAAKPDEPLLWVALGDAQLGQASAAAKAAHDAKTTDASLKDKYAAAEASYQKALDLNAKLAKPKPEITAAANNQLGQAFGRDGKSKEAAAAFDAAAKSDPTKAGTYYFNEAATLFNAGAMDDAAAAADKAVAADPTKSEAYYIKGQALIQKATVDPKTQKIVAPPDCIAAYQKYLEVAPTGPHAEEVKGILQGIGAEVKSTYKAGKPAKK
jgi:tetratricopeptide (TPR) repeat protein